VIEYVTGFESITQTNIILVVNVVIPFGKRHCTRYTASEEWKYHMFTELVPVALSSPALLDGVLLSACRHLSDAVKNPQYMQLALMYKLACIRSLNQILLGQGTPVNDATITLAIFLAADEVGAHFSWPVALD
jgi:hypothetical protein